MAARTESSSVGRSTAAAPSGIGDMTVLLKSGNGSGRSERTDGQDVDRLRERIQAHVVVRAPGPALAGHAVLHLELRTDWDAECGRIEVDGRLAHRVRVDVRDHDHRVGLPAAGEPPVEVLRVDEDAVVVAPVDAEIAQ